MKLTILNALKQHGLSFLLLAVISALIWLLSPTWVIAQQTPLASLEKRFYLIASIFLLWMLKIIVWNSTSAQQKNHAAPFSAEINSYLRILKGRFQGALDFLKKTSINQHNTTISLAKLPWFLLIGPEHSGKSSLLTQADIHFILAKSNKAASSASSDMCDWWVTRDVVLVDVPGHFFTLKTPFKNQASLPTVLWQHLLKLLKTTAHKHLLHGVVIALNLPEIMKNPTQSQRTLLLQSLKKRVQELRAAFGTQLPFHLVITKCDLLPGFVEFFNENTTEELTHSWGITLPSALNKGKFLEAFTHRFNLLIKRLNKQLLWRLHHEHNANLRPYVKDFPLHMERLKESIHSILSALMIPDLCLQSVHLTSAMQNTEEEANHYLHTLTSNTTQQALQILRPPVTTSRAYFIKNFLLQGLLHSTERPHTANKDYTWQHRAVYAAAISMVVSSAILLGHDFQNSIQKAYSIQSDLARYQLYMQQLPQNDNRLEQALPLLAALGQAANAPHSLSRLHFYSNRSQQTATGVYHQALQTIVIPEIKNNLERYLQTASNKNPVWVYTTLKAYLMLADPAHRDANFIARTFNNILSKRMNNQALAELTTHITSAFQQGASIELDQTLAAQARKQLTSLSSIELALVILKSMDTNNVDSMLSLGINVGNPPTLINKNTSNRIANMFTAKEFTRILNEEIHVAANEAVQGNWILGDITPAMNQLSLGALTTQLHNQYVNNYVNLWESQVANIQLYAPKNLLQTDEMIQHLTSNDSPLLQFLQTLQQNTSLAPIASNSPKIQALNSLLVNYANNQDKVLYDVFIGLQQLHNYLQTILTANHLSEMAFTIAAQRMQNTTHDDPITTVHQLADNSPEPLKTWLNTLANQSWDFILQAAGQHVETVWETTIIPHYNSQIANYYPFNQSGNRDVKMQDFIDFLGHRGKLAAFYQTYLKPFVNDTATEWSWKKLDNKRIPFSQVALVQFRRAAEIQQTFFPNSDNKPFVMFTLQPVGLSSNTKSFTLNINGQQISLAKKGHLIPHTLVWPGINSSHATTLNFVSAKNQTNTHTFKGEWGWFKAATHATETVNSRKELLLNFAAKGQADQSVKYLLFTQGHINPFLPLSLGRFELPQELLD